MTNGERGTIKVGDFTNLLTILSEVQRDPRDALAEFVSNGRDALVQGGVANGTVRLNLKREKGALSVSVSDDGIGMSKDKLHHIATHLCDSDKVNVPNMIGHKGIGIISFLQLGDECHIVSRCREFSDSYCLLLQKSSLPDYVILPEKKRPRSAAGTDVYFPNIQREIVRVLTRAKLYEHLKNRYRSALLRNEFTIKLYENKQGGLVLPEQYRGEPFTSHQIRTQYGFIELALYIWHSATQRRRVSLVGEGGVTIYDDICEVDEFNCQPWNSDQVEGEIRFSQLRPSTTRRGVVRDSRKFPVFVQALKTIEPELAKAVEQRTKEHEEKISRQVLTHLRFIFKKILSELEDVESPVRVAFRTAQGKLGPGQVVDELDRVPAGEKRRRRKKKGQSTLAVIDETKEGSVKRRYRPLPMVYMKEFEEGKRHLRSELDRDQKVIYINDAHEDYKRERAEGASSLAFLNYIVLVTTKEYVVWNNPRADQVTIGEDMIRYLVRARRHMPKRL
jgi:hypothetical protein